MEKLFIEATIDSPSLLFDGDMGIIEITGKSLPENAIVCYSPLQKLVKEYITNPQQKTIINFRLEYLNSSSAKNIVEILTALEQLPIKGYVVEIKWFYKAEDDDMLEEGEEFRRMTSIPITLEKEQ
ncbi:MAG: DUF1987 domain-containing protein [Bacteroidales bacterium]|nr:DUF1987 domain-containing protein [Bacteroidales bacterium]